MYSVTLIANNRVCVRAHMRASAGVLMIMTLCIYIHAHDCNMIYSYLFSIAIYHTLSAALQLWPCCSLKFPYSLHSSSASLYTGLHNKKQ